MASVTLDQLLNSSPCCNSPHLQGGAVTVPPGGLVVRVQRGRYPMRLEGSLAR